MWWENISGKLLISNCGSHVMCLLYIRGPLKVAWLEFSETHVHHSVTSISKRRNKQYLVVLVSPLTIWGLCNVMLEILSFSFFVSICCCCLWFFSIILIMLFFNSSWKTKTSGVLLGWMKGRCVCQWNLASYGFWFVVLIFLIIDVFHGYVIFFILTY